LTPTKMRRRKLRAHFALTKSGRASLKKPCETSVAIQHK
jgi:hypothetical protein